jgi:hypothetical protein
MSQIPVLPAGGRRITTERLDYGDGQDGQTTSQDCQDGRGQTLAHLQFGVAIFDESQFGETKEGTRMAGNLR